MTISKKDAKDWGKAHIKGLFGASPVPYTADGKIDEPAFRNNLQYWRDVLGIRGQWVGGFQSEQLGISTAQRKRIFEITQEESQGKQIAICAIMDDVIEDALELATFAADIGARCIGLSGPRIFTGMLGEVSEQTVYEYFQYISDRTELPIILLNQAAMQGYRMSPQLIGRLADLPNCVAIKNVVGGDETHYLETVRLCEDKIVVSDPNERLFLRNYLQHGQRAFIAEPSVMLYQMPHWLPMWEYLSLADSGDVAGATRVSDAMDGVRNALESCIKQFGWYKYTATLKLWFSLQGLASGHVVYPQKELNEAERALVVRSFNESGIGGQSEQGTAAR